MYRFIRINLWWSRKGGWLRRWTILFQYKRKHHHSLCSNTFNSLIQKSLNWEFFALHTVDEENFATRITFTHLWGIWKKNLQNVNLLRWTALPAHNLRIVKREFREIWYCCILMIFLDIFQFPLKSDKISGTTWILMCDLGFSSNLTLNFRSKKKSFEEKLWRKMKHTSRSSRILPYVLRFRQN